MVSDELNLREHALRWRLVERATLKNDYRERKDDPEKPFGNRFAAVRQRTENLLSGNLEPSRLNQRDQFQLPSCEVICPQLA